jgi:hypothetical protein
MKDESTKCRYHPDRSSRVRCMKYGYDYCQECLESCDSCTDPELYCTYRTQCVIWEVCRKTIRARKSRKCSQTDD